MPMVSVDTVSDSGHKNSPLRPCEPNYNLHKKAGGLPLAVFIAPNVHRQSRLGREVCNPAEKSNIP